MFSFLNYPNPRKKNMVVVKAEFIDIPQNNVRAESEKFGLKKTIFILYLFIPV